MCAQPSVLVASRIAFANNFIKVIQDTMVSSAHFALIPENTTEETEKTYPSYVTGMMVLRGDKDLVLTLTFSKVAAADLIVSLLETKYTELIDTEVYDAVMEMTNMIAGRLKTASMELGYTYTLTSPFVFVGPNHYIGRKNRPAGIVRKFKDKQFEMLAGFFFL